MARGKLFTEKDFRQIRNMYEAGQWNIEEIATAIGRKRNGVQKHIQSMIKAGVLTRNVRKTNAQIIESLKK